MAIDVKTDKPSRLLKKNSRFFVCSFRLRKRSCPVFGGKTIVIHKPFNDPYFASGSEEQIMAVFRKVRNDIKAFIETMPESLGKPA